MCVYIYIYVYIKKKKKKKKKRKGTKKDTYVNLQYMTNIVH